MGSNILMLGLAGGPKIDSVTVRLASHAAPYWVSCKKRGGNRKTLKDAPGHPKH